MKISNIKAIKSLSQEDLFIIDWNIGKYCNYNCEYCEPATHNKITNHLSYNEIVNSIKLLCSFFKNKRILLCITGGEPTANPNLLSACKLLYKENINIVITTNGTQSSLYYNDILNYVNHITFSQHFQKNRSFDVFLNKLKEINIIHKDKINVQVMCHGELFNEVKQAVDFYKTHNIAYTIRRIIPISRDKFDPDFNTPQPATIYNDEYLAWILAETEIYKPSIPNIHIIYENNGKILNQSVNINNITANKLNVFTNWICYAGKESIIVRSNGDIYRCVHKVGGKLGNILDKTLTLGDVPPIICTSCKCNCATDIVTTKAINEKYLDLINKLEL